MGKIVSTTPFTHQKLSARIIRADGSVEDLGVIAFNHRSWYIRLAYRLGGWPLASKLMRLQEDY